MADILKQDGVLRDAKGAPCPRPACEKVGQQDWRSDEKVLGKRCVSKHAGLDISTRSVWHRCRSCNMKQSIGIGNPLFEGFIGKGSLGITPAASAFWNCIEEAPATTTARQLGVSEDSGAMFYDRCHEVLAADALYLQSQINWGSGTTATVDIETDCTVMAKWKEAVPSTSTEHESMTMGYNYYVWMGARRRGDASAFFMLPCGVSQSIGEGRVPPESSWMYHECSRLAFGGQKHNLVLMTDGAECYRCRCEACRQVFEEHHWVNHSRKPHPELSRSTDVLADVVSRAMRCGMAGTNTIDAEWGFIKDKLPQNSFNC